MKCDVDIYRAEMIYDHDAGQRRMTTRSYYCKARFANFLLLPTYDFKLERYAKYSNFDNMLVTKHGALTSGAQRLQVNAWLYTTYWSRGVAEYDG